MLLALQRVKLCCQIASKNIEYIRIERKKIQGQEEEEEIKNNKNKNKRSSFELCSLGPNSQTILGQF